MESRKSSQNEFFSARRFVREPERWIRFLTVLGYIFFVSLPALSLSVYYIYVWDPHYVAKNDNLDYPAKYFDSIKSDTERMPRSEFPSDEHSEKYSGLPQQNPNLSEILRERNKDDLSTSKPTSTTPT
ncbi:unnamed protein product [Auanema sp. JU1783]|nr:unnamed protein product [Auanema sp. JU1783]